MNWKRAAVGGGFFSSLFRIPDVFDSTCVRFTRLGKTKRQYLCFPVLFFFFFTSAPRRDGLKTSEITFNVLIAFFFLVPHLLCPLLAPIYALVYRY